MFCLPSELQGLVYSYDPTYHQHYDNVLLEMKCYFDFHSALTTCLAMLVCVPTFRPLFLKRVSKLQLLGYAKFLKCHFVKRHWTKGRILRHIIFHRVLLN